MCRHCCPVLTETFRRIPHPPRLPAAEWSVAAALLCILQLQLTHQRRRCLGGRGQASACFRCPSHVGGRGTPAFPVRVRIARLSWGEPDECLGGRHRLRDT